MKSKTMIPVNFRSLCYGAKFKYSAEEVAVWIKIGHDLVAGWDADKVADSWIGQPVCSFSDDGNVSVLVFLIADQVAPEAPRQEPVAWKTGSIVWAYKADAIRHTTASGYRIQPLYTAPLSPDLIHDRAYRNGLMAGFQFGINGNEKGYAISLERYNTEIHAANAEQLSPDHSGGGSDMVLPKPEIWRIPVSGEWFYGTKEQCEREYAEYTADFTAEDFDEDGPAKPEPLVFLDKLKELNQ